MTELTSALRQLDYATDPTRGDDERSLRFFFVADAARVTAYLARRAEDRWRDKAQLAVVVSGAEKNKTETQ